MTLQDLGSIGEIVGAVGVILSLVYLTVQIRQNTRSVRSASLQEAMRDVFSITDSLSTDHELSRLYWKGLADFDSLDPDERRRFSAYLVGLFRRFENIFYQTRHGALEADFWEGVRKTAVLTIGRPGAAAWWRDASDLFSEEFCEYVEHELLGGGR
ncbi:MAG: hypothetical protein ACQGVC_05945 [Myxococcota bacterium]